MDQLCFLNRTLLDLAGVSDAERDLLWTLFDKIKIISLGLPDSDSARLRHHGIHSEDTLDTLLPLSVDYLHALWPDHRFNKIVALIGDLLKNFLQRQVSFDNAEAYDDNLLFSDAQLPALKGISISPSFVPQDAVNKLCDYGITSWEQVAQLSERAIVRRYGFDTISVNLSILLRNILLCCPGNNR